MNLTTPSRSTAAPMPAAPPRNDLYAAIHKALRHFMLDTLLRVGSLDVRDDIEVATVLAQLEALLAQCESHIRHENEFIHPPLEARQPGCAARIATEHDEHRESVDALREEARQLRGASLERRAPQALRLYRHLALFVADNFQHMHHEETVHNALLWAHFTDAELGALHGRLVASIAPQEMFETARWMIPAMNPVERAGMLNGIRHGAPDTVFAALVSHVRPRLDATAWARLAPEIGFEAESNAAQAA
ncbi:MAG: hemerythrin domain-containing protein [Betaproteobacteria bacterium]